MVGYWVGEKEHLLARNKAEAMALYLVTSMVHTTVDLKVDRMALPKAESKDHCLVVMSDTSMVSHWVFLRVQQTD